MRDVARVLLACAALALCGCAGQLGLVYSHTIEPLSTDFYHTPVVSNEAAGDVKQIHFYVRVLWNDNAIGEVAKEHGIDEVYFADLETLRVLGIWTQQWVHVYGRQGPVPSPADGP
jgi:hypothetical protein